MGLRDYFHECHLSPLLRLGSPHTPLRLGSPHTPLTVGFFVWGVPTVRRHFLQIGNVFHSFLKFVLSQCVIWERKN